MQLGLIIGIVCAIGAVIFAMQNVTPVTVTLGFWNFDGSLALVLLVALGLGALIAGLVSSPAMIRHQWHVAQLGRRATELEHKLAEELRHNDALRAELSALRPGASVEHAALPEEEEKPYVGLRALIAGNGDEKPPSP